MDTSVGKSTIYWRPTRWFVTTPSSSLPFYQADFNTFYQDIRTDIRGSGQENNTQGRLKYVQHVKRRGHLRLILSSQYCTTNTDLNMCSMYKEV